MTAKLLSFSPKQETIVGNEKTSRFLADLEQSRFHCASVRKTQHVLLLFRLILSILVSSFE